MFVLLFIYYSTKEFYSALWRVVLYIVVYLCEQMCSFVRSCCVLRHGRIDKTTSIELETMLCCSLGYEMGLGKGVSTITANWLKHKLSAQLGYKHHFSFMALVWMWGVSNSVSRCIQLPAVAGGRPGAWMSMISCLTVPLNCNHKNHISIGWTRYCFAAANSLVKKLLGH